MKTSREVLAHTRLIDLLSRVCFSTRGISRLLITLPKFKRLLGMVILSLCSFQLSAQENFSVKWPLTSDGSAIPTNGINYTRFNIGNGIESFRYDPVNGATAGGWNSIELDETAYYEYRIAPEANTGIRLTDLNFDVSLNLVNMRTSIHYSLDGFKNSDIPISHSIFVGKNSSSGLHVQTDLIVNYPDTLSVRIYGWSAPTPAVTFFTRDVEFKGIILSGEAITKAPVTRSALSSFTLSVTPINVDCYGNNTGSINLTVTGGTQQFTYAWTGPNSFTASTQNISGLIAGTYHVKVTDAEGTIQETDVPISQPTLLQLTSTSTQISCSGGTGSVLLNAAGGNGNYAYSGDATNNLSPGTYNYIVTDSKGCTSNASAAINPAPAQLVLTATPTQIKCNGEKGSVALSAAGGTLPYTFNSIPTTNLLAGTYNYIVTDSKGCPDAESVVITEPPQITFNAPTITNVSCKGGNNGQVVVNATGGTSAITYSISPSIGNQSQPGSFNSLTAGNYTITARDINNCTETLSITITEPAAALSVTASSNTPICEGSDLNLSSVVAGGTAPYSYSWTGPASYINNQPNPVLTGTTFSNSGIYNLEVRDKNNCPASAGSSVIIKKRPTVAVDLTTQTICPGSPMSPIIISNPNNISETTYSWTRTNTAVITGIENSGSANSITSSLVNSTQAQTWQTTVFTITANANGCSSETTANLIVGDLTPPTFISCTGNATGMVEQQTCVANVSIANPVTSDNCRVAKLIWTMNGATNASSPLTGINNLPIPYKFNLGVTNVTYRVEDVAGNFATCTFNVTVTDKSPPVFTFCPTDITINALTSSCSAIVSYGTPTAVDNCNTPTVVRTSGPESGSSFPIGTTQVVYTATDNAGNSSTCTFNVVVKDITPPVITCPSNKLFEITSGCNLTLTGTQIGIPSATDNCSNPTISNNMPAGGIFPVGNTYIKYIATDASGNKDSCVQLISVTRGIALVNYSYTKYPPSTVTDIPGTLQPTSAAANVISHQSFSPDLLSGRTQIVTEGVLPGPAAFYQIEGLSTPGLFSNLKDSKKETMQYYEFYMGNLGTSYKSFYLYFQFNRDNSSNPKQIFVEWSINGSTFTRSLTVDLDPQKYKPKEWHEVYQTLTGITELNNSPQVFIRIYFLYQGNPQINFDNFQYCAFNEEIVTGTATATTVDCERDSTGSITINNTSPGVWQYTIDGGHTWQESNVFENLPIGTYDVRMRMAGMFACDVVINVALPIRISQFILTCPDDIETSTDNELNNAATINVGPPDIIDDCTEPANRIITWKTTGATIMSGESTVGEKIFNKGTTTITYKVVDISGNSKECSFDVVVLAKPKIICPDNITMWNVGAGSCNYSGYPGSPTITAGDDVIISWEMSGATQGSGTGLITNQAFNIGTTIIKWIATNKVGTDTCNQTIIVNDKEKPAFTLAQDELSFCVNNIIQAFYNDNPTPGIYPEYDDLSTPRPEYYASTATLFDLDPITNNFSDNCCAIEDLELHWRIDFSPTPNPATPAHEPITQPKIIDQTGQPSKYGELKFPGDGVFFSNVKHFLFYWLVDCNGTPSEEKMVTINIKPRPGIIKMTIP